MVHGHCQTFFCTANAQDRLHHRCPQAKDNKRHQHQCPLCLATVCMTPRSYRLHRLKCVYDPEDTELMHEIQSLNEPAQKPARMQQQLLPWRGTLLTKRARVDTVAAAKAQKFTQLSLHRWLCPIPSKGRGSALPTMGDIESNPGPARHTNKQGEDFMLDPTIFQKVVSLLSPEAPPVLDAFANLHNSQTTTYWSTQEDALSRHWRHKEPIWANPSFSLLPTI